MLTLYTDPDPYVTLTLHTDSNPYVKFVCNAHFTYEFESVCNNWYVNSKFLVVICIQKFVKYFV